MFGADDSHARHSVPSLCGSKAKDEAIGGSRQVGHSTHCRADNAGNQLLQARTHARRSSSLTTKTLKLPPLSTCTSTPVKLPTEPRRCVIARRSAGLRGSTVAPNSTSIRTTHPIGAARLAVWRATMRSPELSYSSKQSYSDEILGQLACVKRRIRPTAIVTQQALAQHRRLTRA